MLLYCLFLLPGRLFPQITSTAPPELLRGCHLNVTILSHPVYSRSISHYLIYSVQFSCSVVSDSLRPHTARQASLSITDSRSSPKLMSIESGMPSSHLILSPPSSALTASGSFQMSQLFIAKVLEFQLQHQSFQ